MKKILNCILAVFLLVLTLNAQDTIKRDNYVFQSEQFTSDYEKLIALKSKYGDYHRKWAQNLATTFSVDKNGAVHCDYVIYSNKPFDKQKVMETSVGWFNYSFSSAKNAIEQCDYENGIIIAHGDFYKLAQDNITTLFYAKIAYVNVKMDVIIRFKDDRIRIETIIRHYNLIFGDSQLNSKNSLYQVSEVFPFKETDNQILFSRAYINSYANSFNTVDTYIKYLNNNVQTAIELLDDNW